MIPSSRPGPSRTEVVDYGYRAAAERRQRLLAAASPAVRARILGKSPAVDRHEPAGAGGEIRELERQRESLAAEVERLRQEQRRLSPGQGCSIAELAKQFVVELARVGYRIHGHPATLGHLQSPRRTAAWSRARMVAMWLCTELADEGSMPKVGRYFARHHTTVVYARRQIGRVLKQEPALRRAALATCAALELEPPAALGAAGAGKVQS